MFGIWRGGFFDGNGQFIVYKTGLSAEEESEVRQELGHAYVTCMLHRSPPAPSLGKWSPLPLCLDWYVVGMAGRGLAPLIRDSTGNVKCGADREHEDVKDACESFMLDVSWSKLVSKGRMHCLNCVEDASWAVKVVIDDENINKRPQFRKQQTMRSPSRDPILRKPAWLWQGSFGNFEIVIVNDDLKVTLLAIFWKELDNCTSTTKRLLE